MNFATVIYDLADHSLSAMLEGKGAKNLKSWLAKNPHIKFVARDRSFAFANAVSEVLPESIQVADRFHLLDKLINQLKELSKSELPDHFFIENTKLVDQLTVTPSQKKEKLIVKTSLYQFDEISYDNSPPLDANGMEILCDSRNHNFKNSQIYITQKENRHKTKKELLKSEDFGITLKTKKSRHLLIDLISLLLQLKNIFKGQLSTFPI